MPGKVVHQVEALKSSVEDLTRKLNNALVGMSGLQESDQESMGTGDGNIILQCFQNLLINRRNEQLALETNEKRKEEIKRS
jgi:hypothetical protein